MHMHEGRKEEESRGKKTYDRGCRKERRQAEIFTPKSHIQLLIIIVIISLTTIANIN